MPLLLPTEAVTARIAADAGALASHVRNAIVLANRITGHALNLPTAELLEWLNARPLEQRVEEFTSHGDMGDALNDAAMVSEIATGRPDASLGRVDVRSVVDKLASRGLALEIVGGVFTVSAMEVAPPAAED